MRNRKTRARRAVSVAIALAAAVVAVSALGASPEAAPARRIPETDRIRLAEAFRLAEAIGDRLWPGWILVPFAVVLVSQ